MNNRELDILTDDGLIAPSAFLTLFSVMSFPEDKQSRRVWDLLHALHNA
jgi:hypothetical protein